MCAWSEDSQWRSLCKRLRWHLTGHPIQTMLDSTQQELLESTGSLDCLWSSSVPILTTTRPHQLQKWQPKTPVSWWLTSASFFVPSSEEFIKNLVHGFKPYDIMDNLDINVQSAITMRQLLSLFLACRNAFKGSMIWKRAKPIKVHDITLCQGFRGSCDFCIHRRCCIPVHMTLPPFGYLFFCFILVSDCFALSM